MSTVKRVVFLVACLASPLAAIEAEAGVADDPVIITAVTLGTLAGVTNSIAALVYSNDDLSFDTPWIVSSLFSSAICGSLTVSLIVDAATEGEAGILIAALLTGAATFIPTYWVIVSSLSEVGPGEPFDAPLETVAQPRVTVDPMSQLAPRSARPALIFPIGVTF